MTARFAQVLYELRRKPISRVKVLKQSIGHHTSYPRVVDKHCCPFIMRVVREQKANFVKRQANSWNVYFKTPARIRRFAAAVLPACLSLGKVLHITLAILDPGRVDQPLPFCVELLVCTAYCPITDVSDERNFFRRFALAHQVRRHVN